MVATAVETTPATVAITSERMARPATSASFQAATYQRSEKPSQIASEVPALKE